VAAARVRVQRDYYSELLKTTREGVGGNIQRISDIRGQMKSSSQQRAVLVGEYWMIYESFYSAIKVKRQRTRAWTICQYRKCH
jgi:hypothetical protein